MEAKFPFEAEIQACVGRKALGVRRAWELLLEIDDAKG